MRKKHWIFMISLVVANVLWAGCTDKNKKKEFVLSEQVLKDKIKGAWAGQTLGCTYGGPTEFKFLGTIIQDFVPISWEKGIVKKWYDTFPGLYDDVYVDLTFVEVFERCGLDAPVDSFASAFKRTEYPLWHANQVARYNLHQGVMPPESGYWKNNPHANCIDFQIEADFAGIMSPAMPNQSAIICDKVGHIMSYGEGWYGGVYVAAMYSLAYISDDIEYIVKEALKIIPEKSDFHQCMADVFKWHEEFPNDWKRTWFELQNKWSEEIGCPEGIHNSFNIGTKINAAYILLGLLYGQGDFGKTLDISTRAGQDSDCNPASAGGIIGTMLGYDKIPEKWKEPLYEVEDIPFSNTDISLNKAYEMTYDHAIAMILKHGGKQEDGHLILKEETVKPVAYEASFEDLTVNGKYFVDKSVESLGEYAFEGTGVVVKGYMGGGGLPANYEGEMEVYVDGKFYETTKLPVNINHRKCELFYIYDLPVGHHTVSFKLNNPVGSAVVWVTEIISYTKK